MPIRSLALAALLALLACTMAQAAPVTVQLRVEGATRTIFEGPVTTDGKSITKGADTVVCDGTLNGTNTVPGPTATSALDDGAIAGGFDWDAAFFGDFFISRVAEVSSSVWGLAVNYQQAPVGGCQLQVHAGDEVLFASEFFAGPDFAQLPLLKLGGPARAVTGKPFAVSVSDGGTGAPFAGAAVGGAQTGPEGVTTLAFKSPGLVRLKAEATGTIRSNAVNVCVSDNGTGDCGVPPAQLGTAAGAVKDSVAPRVRIRGPRDGRRFRRGPRLLSGTASDDVGVARVKLALRRHERGKPCRWWSASAERFAGRGCARKVFFGIDANARWSYLLPRRLPPGRYVLDVKAFDRARNRDERFVRGTNRVVFYVGRGYRPNAAATSSRTRGVSLPVMLSGRSRQAHAVVRARPAFVKVGHRTCRVGASTPLAALVALLRKEHVGYRVRDFGNCSRATASGSGQLFVRRIGKDRNRGNDGWFYKVDDRAPEVGAGDLAARVGAGDRLLWFYCVFDEAARSCQRSLRATVVGAAATAARVRVRGYDNAGHAVPVAGATVSLGPETADTNSGGVALLPPLAAGNHDLVAVKPGLVPSFPEKVNLK
jgi:hypothetical protein